MLRVPISVLLLSVVLLIPSAQAAPLNAGPPILTSATNPLAGCPPDGSGVNFPGAEVEPWIEVNPTNRNNIVGFYQQDRYSNGGAKGNVATMSMNRGATWTQVAVPNDTRCTGGRFQRSSDPWISFGPNRGVARHEPRDRPRHRSRVRRQRHDLQPVDERRPDLGAGDPPRDGPRRALPERQELDHRGSQQRELRVRRVGPAAGVAGLGDQPGERDRARFQGPDLLHPHHERRQLVGAGAQDLRDRRQQADARQSNRRRAGERRRLAVRLLRRHRQRVEPARRDRAGEALVHPVRRPRRQLDAPDAGRRHDPDEPGPRGHADRRRAGAVPGPHRSGRVPDPGR
jgi:hypothetical protein